MIYNIQITKDKTKQAHSCWAWTIYNDPQWRKLNGAEGFRTASDACQKAADALRRLPG